MKQEQQIRLMTDILLWIFAGKEYGQTQEKIVTVLLKSANARLLNFINVYTKEKLPEVPEELEYILTEVTVKKYNKIGAEGMAQETTDGMSNTYVSKDFDEYEKDIKRYLQSNHMYSRWKVHFL